MVRVAGWCVRQLELFTSLSHREIGETVLSVLRFFFWCSMVIVGISIISMSIVIMLAFGGIPYAQHVTLRYLKEFLRKHEEKLQLPKEIKTRALPRILTLVFTFTWTLALVLTLFDKEIQNIFINNDPLVSLFLVMFICVITCSPITIVISEYYMCTFPLPPGEKERRKQEKEARNMSPSSS